MDSNQSLAIRAAEMERRLSYLEGLEYIATADRILLTNGDWVGISAADERIEFYTAGHIAVMGANLGVGVASPTTLLDVYGGVSRITGPVNTNKIFQLQAYDNSGYSEIYQSAAALHLNTVAGKDVRLYSPTSVGGTIVFTIESDYGAPWTRILNLLADGKLGIGLTPTTNMVGLSVEAGVLTVKETTTPTADADYGKLYTKNDNKLYFQDGAGNEHVVAFV